MNDVHETNRRAVDAFQSGASEGKYHDRAIEKLTDEIDRLRAAMGEAIQVLHRKPGHYYSEHDIAEAEEKLWRALDGK